MRTDEAIKYFGGPRGGVSKLAHRLGISRKSVWKWGEYPPAGRQYELEVLTSGELKAERHGDDENEPDAPATDADTAA